MSARILTAAEQDAMNRQLGRNLRTLRLIAGLSQNDIAALLGISYQQVQKYETGKNRISLPFLAILKDALDVPYERFFDGVNIGKSGPGDAAQDKNSFPRSLCRKIAAIEDPALQKKLCRVIDIFVS